MNLGEDLPKAGENVKTKSQNESILSNLMQCQRCGIPLCRPCCLKLEAQTIETSNRPSGENKVVPVYHNAEECRILQKAGITNLSNKSRIVITQMYAILPTLRCLLAAKSNPKLLELEVCNNICHYNCIYRIIIVQNYQ